jgi:hypothetical protein
MYTNTGKISTNKKVLPGYRQVTACIPEKLFITFKMICSAEQSKQNDAVEMALQAWVNSKITNS